MTAKYTVIDSQVLATSAASVTFNLIPGGYKDLVVVQSGSSPFQTKVQLRINGDTGYNYNFVTAEGTGSITESLTSTGNNKIFNGGGNDTIDSTIAMTTWEFMDYSVTNKHKSVLIRSSSSSLIANMVAARWASTAAITSLTFELQSATSYPAGSTFRLLGVN